MVRGIGVGAEGVFGICGVGSNCGLKFVVD